MLAGAQRGYHESLMAESPPESYHESLMAVSCSQSPEALSPRHQAVNTRTISPGFREGPNPEADVTQQCAHMGLLDGHNHFLECWGGHSSMD